MKKIMHVGQMIGGLDVYIRNSISYMKGDFEYVIVHGEDDDSRPVVYKGKEIKEYKVALHRDLNFAKDLKCLRQIVKIINREKPDIIHCHSAKGGVLGRTAGWVTHTKTLYTPHAFSYLCTASKIKRNVYKIVEKATRFETYVLACSESEQQMAISEVGYTANHALVWHNAVPDTSTERGHVPEIKGEYVCYIGRPCYQKNVLFLVDVIKAVKDKGCGVKFVLLGVEYHSPDLQAVKDKIEDLGLEDDIVMVPWISHEDCQEYVRGALFYVSTSLYEGLPLAVIEAMAQGKAVVASDVVGNVDCVKNGETGLLLPLDSDAFAVAICRLAKDNSLRRKMEKKARQTFERDFLIDNRIALLEELYKTITAS